MPDMLPPFARTALLLDLDGTLLDFAPTPDSVVVPPACRRPLARLAASWMARWRSSPAGPVDQIDALLPGIVPAVAGEHGGALRPAPGAPLQRPDLPERAAGPARRRRRALAAGHPGVLVEHKARGFVLHYRLAPGRGRPCSTGLDALLAPPARAVPVARRAHGLGGSAASGPTRAGRSSA